jgi:uncharacterized protein
LPASLAGMIGYWVAGLRTSAVTHTFLVSLPGVGVAILLGRAATCRLNGPAFLRLVYVGLITVGVVFLVQGVV